MSCQGWPADRETGVILRSPTGDNLRETKRDTDGLIEVIKCGLPGTEMPYHGRATYRDDRCYGSVMSDFDSGSKPRHGTTFGDQDVANVVAYLQTQVIGLGELTFEECADYFEDPAARTCSNLKYGRDA